VMQRRMPCVERAVAQERNLLPMVEGPGNFHRGWRFGLLSGQASAEDLRKSLFAFSRFSLQGTGARGGFEHQGSAFGRSLSSNQIAKSLKHSVQSTCKRLGKGIGKLKSGCYGNKIF
jgi:hypothetical protein